MRRSFRPGNFLVPGLFAMLGLGVVAVGVLVGMEPSPTVAAVSVEDCNEIRSSRKERRKCFESNAEARIDVAREQLAQLPPDVDPVLRDHVRVRMAASQPALATSLCEGVETDEGQRLCRRLAGRPHLYAVSQEWTQREKGRDSKQGQRKTDRRRGSGGSGEKRRGRGRKKRQAGG